MTQPGAATPTTRTRECSSTPPPPYDTVSDAAPRSHTDGAYLGVEREGVDTLRHTRSVAGYSAAASAGRRTAPPRHPSRRRPSPTQPGAASATAPTRGWRVRALTRRGAPDPQPAATADEQHRRSDPPPPPEPMLPSAGTPSRGLRKGGAAQSQRRTRETSRRPLRGARKPGSAACDGGRLGSGASSNSVT